MEPNIVRVATWNVLHTAVATMGPRTVEAAAHIRAINPDVLLVQEAAYREHHYDVLTDLAEACDLDVAVRGYTRMYEDDSAFEDGHSSCVGILTKLPILEATTFLLPAQNAASPQACTAQLALPSGNVLIAATGHLAWGGAAESQRFAQVRTVDRIVEGIEQVMLEQGQPCVSVFGGDFNTTPDSRSLRWLRGLEPGPDGHDSFWVDSWSAGGDGSAGYTSRPDNPLGHDTARLVGITRPERNPYRRIDYLMVRGWVYGSAGDPVRAGLFGGESLTGETLASDHLGVWADLSDSQARTSARTR